MRTHPDSQFATGDTAPEPTPGGRLAALGSILERAVSGVFNLAFAILLGAPGLVLLCWAALAAYKVERAFELALWAANNSPLPLTVPALRLANDAIQDSSIIGAGIVGLILCLAAFSSLRTARQMLGPAGTSRDGKGRIVLKTAEPRVGRPLEGSILLKKGAKPGQKFTVRLSCERRLSREGERDDVHTAHFEEQEVSAVRGAQGWSVPFRFQVPATAPASSSTSLLATQGYRWRVEMVPAKAFIAVPTEFPLALAGAPASEVRAALAAGETPAQRKVLDAIAREHGNRLEPHERARMQELSPEKLAALKKNSEAANRFVKKAGAVLMVVFFVIPAILVALLFLVGALLGR